MSTHHKGPDQEPEGHLQGLVRTVCGLLAAFLLIYGVRGIYRDDIFIPGSFTHGADLHGVPAWMVAGALFCFAAFLISCLLRSFESPPNRPGYRIFNRWMKYVGATLFFGGFVVAILFIHKR